ncbi:hypothetical protein PF005_g15208 [Phytophthora fragariae]|uniref:Uncharacterized protein n=2 Tax=Phytophthora fragariae TaxID=53985 RepID=A0A6A3RPR3_9STRA|nr:hypothetical protein PF003_g19417 [Phytophthora fragariae]KAE8933279.1 hypothetical protein PF009_g16711 [Phytophthora fragariae]KAE9100532.1 hypothetical protein PF007_g15476 [Phytophthora fragariae]KAE9136646.1 hypothetical protein PF006_g14338 [Phytophthora fragariae]KAE9200802.1 hypothetical protein PF005_g15208 [Phytophthora fragariae]
MRSTGGEDEENTTSGKKTSRNAEPNTKVYGYCATIRSRAARDACTYGWKFVEVHQPVSDVDIVKYPYELVREERLLNASVCGEKFRRQQEYEQQWQHWLPEAPYQQPQREQKSDQRTAFLNCFGSSYFESAVRDLNGITVKGSLTVKASFGRNLYRLHTLNADHAYQLDRLRTVRYPRDLQSSWSNVCDDDAPIVRALIEELNRADSVKLETTRLKLTMRCCLMSRGGPQYAKLTYFREDDKWVFAEVRALSDVYACHDISLDNNTSFRVKVTTELVEPGRAWWGSIKDFVLFDETDGNPFTTKVSMVSCSDKNLRVEFVVIKWVSGTVNFRGLSFQSRAVRCFKRSHR